MIDVIILKDRTEIPTLVSMFRQNAGRDYVTHIEIEEGRATEDGDWSDELYTILNEELFRAVIEERVIVAVEGPNILGYALITETQNTITIEDIISTQRGIGSDLLSYIENRGRRYGQKILIADVGPNNIRAQKFMEAFGYKVSTIVYTKNI
jgi:GNAT superfamily N-acetyltransferase